MNRRENSDGSPQQECSGEALRFALPLPTITTSTVMLCWFIAGSGVKLVKEAIFLLLIIVIKDKVYLVIGPRVGLSLQYNHRGTRLFAFFILLS